MAQEQAPEHSVVGQSETNRLDETSGQIVDLEVHHLDLLDDVGVIGLQLPVPAVLLSLQSLISILFLIQISSLSLCHLPLRSEKLCRSFLSS